MVEWRFGFSLSASRNDLTRATDSLTRDGFVTHRTEKNRNRVTHLRLTCIGFRRAHTLAHGETDLGRLGESLAPIDWADELWNELDWIVYSH